MKVITLLLCLFIYLYADSENKIVLITYSNKALAQESLHTFVTSHHTFFKQLHVDKPIDIALFQSQQYYFLALKPFATREAAQQILNTLRSFYPSAYISSYPNAVNRLITSKPLVSPPTPSNDQQVAPDDVNAVSPVVLEKEFLEPLSLEEILHTGSTDANSTSNNSSISVKKHPHHSQAQHVQTLPTDQHHNPILYLSYSIIVLLTIALIVLMLKKRRLDSLVQYQQALLNRQEHSRHENIPTIHIDVVDLSRYIHTALQHALKEDHTATASKPLHKIQTCVTDILSINSFMHGELYIQNREFPLSYITQELAHRYALECEVSKELPQKLLGCIDIIERIFLRLSYIHVEKIGIEGIAANEETLQLECSLTYKQNAPCSQIDNELIKELVNSIGGSVSPQRDNYALRHITLLTLPLQLVEEDSLKVKRP